MSLHGLEKGNLCELLFNVQVNNCFSHKRLFIWSETLLRINDKVLCNTVPLIRLEFGTPQSQVEPSISEQLR